MNDAIKLQFGSDNIFRWCKNSDLNLNWKILHTYFFFFKWTTIYYICTLTNINLSRMFIDNGLGVWFDVKFSSNTYTFHIHFIRNKAFAKLGFLKHTWSHLRDAFALETL